MCAAWLNKRAQDELGQLQQQTLYRKVSPPKEQVLSFTSNDYLGLSSDPRLIEAGRCAIAKYGVGGRSSSVVSGYTDAHAKLEALMCELTGRSGAIFFPNAFTANQAVFDALVESKDQLYVHRDNHASLNHVLRTGHYTFKRFYTLPEIESQQPVWIISDHVFSVTGYKAPIAEYIALAKKHDAVLFLDDVHGVGLDGLGLAADYSESDLPLVSWGFAKALGCYGGAVLGKVELTDCIRQKSRMYCYSTAVPRYMVEVACAALRLAYHADDLRERLQNNLKYFAQKISDVSCEHYEESPIFTLWYHGEASAARAHQVLRQKGIDVTLMRWPTVNKGQACLRIALRADHSEAMLDRLLLELQCIGEKRWT